MNLARLRRIAAHRWRSLLYAQRADQELAGELAFHLEQLVEEKIAGGMAPREARYQAQRELGNLASLAEQCRDQRRLTWLRDLIHDVHYAWRTMRQSPGFTGIAALSLALGIGANTAILGVGDAMWRGPLPYPDPDRLLFIRTYSQANPNALSNASQPDFFAISDGAQAFASLGCALADQNNLGVSEDTSSPAGQAPERLYGQALSPGVFETLGVAPMLGRTFRTADYHRGPPGVVILSEPLWRRRFGADPKILGKRILLTGVSTEVIGVMPAGFHFGEEPPEYWLPMQLQRIDWQTGIRYFIVAGRLKPGVSTEQAQGELNQVAAQLAARFPDTHTGWGMRLQPLREALFGWTRRGMLALEGAVVLMLLIACANVAGLLLARSSSRRRELAVRAALGAGRERILRQLLAESLMLSAIGGLLGLVVAWTSLRVIPAIQPPPNAPRLPPMALNWHMFLLTGLTTVAVGLIFGIGPALASLGEDLPGALKDSSGASGVPHGRLRSRSVLVSAQIALAFVLLMASGLVAGSFLRLARRDLNFTPQGLLTFEYRLPLWQAVHIVGSNQGLPYVQSDPAQLEKLERILTRLRAFPSAESVAGIAYPPVNSLIVPTIAVTLDGAGHLDEASRDAGEAAYFLITPRFFSTMQAVIVRGREFSDTDTQGAPWVAVVNEAAARRFWPGQDPIGQRFRLESGPDDRPRRVIGVVRDIPLGNMRLTQTPVVYASYWQQPLRSGLAWAEMQAQMTFVVRTPASAASPDARAFEQAARSAAAEIDPEVPLAKFAAMETYTRQWTGPGLYYAAVLAGFACFATFLAAVGAYGVMSYHVAQRTREIGIRLALGARPWQILRLVGGGMARIAGAGLAAGWISSLPLARLIAAQLASVGVAPAGDGVFTAALAVLAAAASIATFWPLRQTLRLTPLRGLNGR